MKKVLGEVTKYIFALFAIGVLGLLMSLTYQALQLIFPQSPANRIWGLVLFDIAMICWALAFIFQSETITQYAVSAIGFVAAFIGTLGMVAADVLLSGQHLVAADAAQIGQWMIWGFIGMTTLHVALLWGHHFGHKEIMQKVEIGIQRGEVTSDAIRQAKGAIEIEKASLAYTLAQDIIAEVKRDLGLIPVQGTPFEKKQAEVEAVDIPHPEENSIKDEQLPAQPPFPGQPSE
jgi:hypothetical protein